MVVLCQEDRIVGHGIDWVSMYAVPRSDWYSLRGQVSVNWVVWDRTDLG
jgi:hypothetical protein